MKIPRLAEVLRHGMRAAQLGRESSTTRVHFSTAELAMPNNRVVVRDDRAARAPATGRI